MLDPESLAQLPDLVPSSSEDTSSESNDETSDGEDLGEGQDGGEAVEDPQGEGG